MFAEEPASVGGPTATESDPKTDAAKSAPSKPSDTSGQDEQSGQQKNQTTQLIELAASALLFKNQQRDPYIEVRITGRREVWPLEGADVRDWLVHQFFERYGRTPKNDALNHAIATLCAKAKFHGQTLNVAVRVAQHEGRIFVDLCDELRTVIEIDAAGWRPADNPPIRFRRPKGMLALPMPEAGGSIDEFRQFVPSASDDHFVLIVAFGLAALNPAIACPLLGLSGEAGSGKSETSRFVRALVDPNEAPFRELTNEARALFISASNSRVLAFDNLSHLSNVLSDRLAKIITGTSDSQRKLYTNDEEQIFAVRNAIIVNGIEDVIFRSDLVDRAILIELPRMKPELRLDLNDLYSRFRSAHPRILGVLFSAISHGLANARKVKRPTLSRMADFEIWGIACEGALWPAGTFERAYHQNLQDSVTQTLDGDPVASAIRDLMQSRDKWKGEAEALLKELTSYAPDGLRNSNQWPKSPAALGQRLSRANTSLEKIGIQIDRGRTGKGRRRVITITKTTTEE